jgi:hypothetical protein
MDDGGVVVRACALQMSCCILRIIQGVRSRSEWFKWDSLSAGTPQELGTRIRKVQKRAKSKQALSAGMARASKTWLGGRAGGGGTARYLELLEHELLHVEDLLLGVGVVADVDKIPHLGGVNLLVF